MYSIGGRSSLVPGTKEYDILDEQLAEWRWGEGGGGYFSLQTQEERIFLMFKAVYPSTQVPSLRACCSTELLTLSSPSRWTLL